MVWGLGELAALAEDPSSIASTHMQFITICDCSSAVFLRTQSPGMHEFGEHTYMPANTHTHLKVKIKNSLLGLAIQHGPTFHSSNLCHSLLNLQKLWGNVYTIAFPLGVLHPFSFHI